MVQKKGISFLFDEAYLMEINLTYHAIVDGVEVTFIPKVYGNLGHKFMVADDYVGQLYHLLINYIYRLKR
jgi:hypothetical protein